MSNESSLFRLQRPCVMVKAALWCSLVVLFVIQQISAAVMQAPDWTAVIHNVAHVAMMH
jgi:hypothetical protein